MLEEITMEKLQEMNGAFYPLSTRPHSIESISLSERMTVLEEIMEKLQEMN